MLRDFGALVRLPLLAAAISSVGGAALSSQQWDSRGLADTARPLSAKEYYRLIEEAADDDLAPTSASSVGWRNLDPRQQSVGSSYSVVETSGASTGPRHFAYSSRREYDDPAAVDEWPDEHRRRAADVAGRPGKSKIGFPRERGGGRAHHAEGPAGPLVRHRDVELLQQRRRRPKKAQRAESDADEERRLARHQRRRQQQQQQQRPNPRQAKNSDGRATSSAALSSASAEEELDVEPLAPLLGAGSGSVSARKLEGGGGDDLKKSGSYSRRGHDDGSDSYEEGYDGEKHYDKEGGKKYVAAHKSEAADKARKGYKKEEAFDVAEDEKHDKEEKKAEVGEKHGLKKGHTEQEKHFGEGYEGKAGEKGVSVTKKGGHKKGHKKSGFHKVHHKDEYKKDEVFYDEGHDGDEREEHAHERQKHAKEKGGAAKKAVVDSRYQEGRGEKTGSSDKGHHFEEASGHQKEKSEQAHHDAHSEFDKKGGLKEGEKHGHEEGGSSKGGYSGHDYF